MIDIIIPVITSSLLILSEILPFIKSIKTNGILDTLIYISKYILEKSNVNGDIESQNLLCDNDDENNDTNENNKTDNQHTKELETEMCNKKIEKLQYQINDLQKLLTKGIESNVSIYENLIESRKMQSYEKYEMDYIKNYIRINYPEKQLEIKYLSEINKELLRELRYIIDYDSTSQIYVIKW
jgi:hypothetical protein